MIQLWTRILIFGAIIFVILKISGGNLGSLLSPEHAAVAPAGSPAVVAVKTPPAPVLPPDVVASKAVPVPAEPAVKGKVGDASLLFSPKATEFTACSRRVALDSKGSARKIEVMPVAAPYLPAQILAPDGAVRGYFLTELATTPAEQEKGLMYRCYLPAQYAMLFVFRAPSAYSFWMKNTYIPLDLFFIDATGRIVSVVKRATPMSLKTIVPPVPVQYVLEMAGGSADFYGIQEGDMARLPVGSRP